MKFYQAGVQTLLVRVALIGFAFVTGIINARYLGPENLGILTLLLLIPNTCFRFGNLGLGSGLSYFVSKQELSPRNAILHSLVGSCLLGGASIVFLLASLRFESSPWGGINHQYIWMVVAITPVCFLHNFMQRVVSGFLLITNHNISEVLLVIVNLAALSFLVVLLDLGLTGSVAAFIAAEIVVACYLVACVMKSGREISDHDESKFSLFAMWDYCKWNYLTLLNKFLFDQLPLFVLNYYAPFAHVGLYAVGKNLAARALVIPDTFSNVMFPYNSSIEAHQAKKRTDSVVRNFLLVMSLIASVLFLLSRPFMALLYGAQYQDSVLYFRLILPTLVFFPVYKFQIVHLTSVGLSREATKVSFYSLPIIGVLSFLLIPRMGALGACLSLSLTNFLLALISMYYYLKYTNSTLLEVLKFTDEDYGYYRAFWLKLKLGTRS